MKMVFIGPPGSGKGTVSQKLVEKFGFKHISTGDMIREHIAKKTSIGLQVKEILEKGDLVSDSLMQDLVSTTLNDISVQKTGFILDGFPRTLPQTEWFVHNIVIDYYIFFDISEKIVIERISGRRIHAQSNRIYHVKFAPPKIEGKDDLTGEPLIHRSDDMPEKVLYRLRVYQEQTYPIINYIKQHGTNYCHINADQNEAAVLDDILSLL